MVQTAQAFKAASQANSGRAAHRNKIGGLLDYITDDDLRQREAPLSPTRRFAEAPTLLASQSEPFLNCGQTCILSPGRTP